MIPQPTTPQSLYADYAEQTAQAARNTAANNSATTGWGDVGVRQQGLGLRQQGQANYDAWQSTQAGQPQQQAWQSTQYTQGPQPNSSGAQNWQNSRQFQQRDISLEHSNWSQNRGGVQQASGYQQMTNNEAATHADRVINAQEGGTW